MAQHSLLPEPASGYSTRTRAGQNLLQNTLKGQNCQEEGGKGENGQAESLAGTYLRHKCRGRSREDLQPQSRNSRKTEGERRDCKKQPTWLSLFSGYIKAFVIRGLDSCYYSSTPATAVTAQGSDMFANGQKQYAGAGHADKPYFSPVPSYEEA